MPDSKIRPTARPQHVSDSQPVDAVRWRVFLMCFLVVLFDGFDTAAIGYIAPSLMQDWGVAKPALAPVLSAALFGLAAGALMAGPLADRWGRRLALIGSVAVFGAACLASAFSPDLTTLTALRFITGVGLGAAMPNAVTLVSECSPPARRAFITNAMFCGFPLGAALGGFLAGWMIPALGWRSVLQLGGVAPLVLLPALAIWLPESLRYLQTRQNEPDRAQVKAPRSIALVLSRPFRLGSLMLWLAYFMGLVVFYALINWMPVLFRESGMDPRTASLITALFPLGGVGAIALGWRQQCAGPGLRRHGAVRLGHRPGHRWPWRADGRGLRGWPGDERRPGLDASAGCRLLSHRRPRHWRGLDAGYRPLRRHCRLLPGG